MDPIKQTPVNLTWKHTPQYDLLSKDQKQQAAKYNNKLDMYNITTLNQIQTPTTEHVLSPQEFKIIFKAPQK
jgi:hypothetical protein